MGKMIAALKKLGNKLNGKLPASDNTVGVINEIADDYEQPDLTPYATKTYVDGLMSGALKRQIVQALPETNIDTNTIYMVLDQEASQQGNVYNEYLYINEAWELIGTTATSGGLLSEIVDANGNARFVEGNLVDGSAGATITYKKWSLSGTHLMFVVAGLVNGNGTISANRSIVYLRDLPNYIRNKIVTLNSDGLVTQKQEYLYGKISGKVEMEANLYYVNIGGIEEFRIFLTASATNPSSSQPAYFRIQFDLLIDTD